jgi:hypothetical protein
MTPLEGAATAQTLADSTLGVAQDITKTLPVVANTLRGTGGLLAFGAVYHGFSTGNYWEAGWGVLDVTAGVASLFPPADFITGPYFAGRLGMGLTELALTAAKAGSSSCVR